MMDAKPLVAFAHGKESGPWGSKIKAMAKAVEDIGYEVISVDYQGIDDPDVRVQKLIETLEGREAVLVGSSMGGYVSAAAATRVKCAGVFVIAPAFRIPGYDDFDRPTCPFEIVHGWHDEIIDAAKIIDFASESSLPLHLVDDSHRLLNSVARICELLTAFLIRLSTCEA